MSKVKHIALIKFKADTAAEQVEKVFADLMDLSETVDGIEDYVSGPNISPEVSAQGFTHGYIVTFKDLPARDAYLAHSEHARLKGEVQTLADAMLLFDFEV